MTGGVSAKRCGSRKWEKVRGEGGIVIKSMDVGIGCAAHSVGALPPLFCFLGWWGIRVNPI